jgi:hypothetical protein
MPDNDFQGCRRGRFRGGFAPAVLMPAWFKVSGSVKCAQPKSMIRLFERTQQLIAATFSNATFRMHPVVNTFLAKIVASGDARFEIDDPAAG